MDPIPNVVLTTQIYQDSSFPISVSFPVNPRPDGGAPVIFFFNLRVFIKE